MLADQVGCGKSAQVIACSQVLFEANDINNMVVLCPGAARGVWADPHPALGEVTKHSWPSVPNYISEFSRIHRKIDPGDPKSLLWVVSNYEYIRRKEHLGTMLKFLAGRRFWLICDEAWALKDCGTDQWKAAYAIRKLAARVTLLNGTPVADTPLDLFAQMKLLDPNILGIKYFSHFRARYAILKPNMSFPMITGWQNLEELSAKVSPYVLRRTTRDCFDLPPILEPILLEARLSDTTWKLYTQMRDNMVAWLDDGDASVVQNAITRGMRLAQITSGFLGGVEKLDIGSDELDFGGPVVPYDGKTPINALGPTIREVGREKLDVLLAFIAGLSPQPQRILIWSRFRAEVERTADALHEASGRTVHKLYGAQSTDERAAAVAALNPDIDPGEEVAVVGNAQAGGAALNLAGAALAIDLSRDFNLRIWLQKRGRIDRPGQRQPIRYVDIVATGPKGQRTIEHHTLAALRGKEDIAKWTASTWRTKLLEE